LGLLGVGAAIALSVPASAAGAVELGETFVPENIFTANWIGIQAASPDDSYEAPSAGVITSWSFRAAATGVPQGLKLKVARPAGPPTFQIVGESAPENPVASTLNTYDTRVSVAAGDVIGLYMGSLDSLTWRGSGAPVLGEPGTVGDVEHEGDIAPGGSDLFGGPFDVQLDVSAQLEPDEDGDGFGDETQDECPTKASTQSDCVPPQTEITKGAPNKLDKHKVKFKFTADEPNVTFECKIDRKPYKPCTSPRKVKRLDDGKHKFKVVATDEAGNTDPSAAKDKFKVVD
jgi:hypothetical protein